VIDGQAEAPASQADDEESGSQAGEEGIIA
jgi:hypothetical protein